MRSSCFVVFYRIIYNIQQQQQQHRIITTTTAETTSDTEQKQQQLRQQQQGRAKTYQKILNDGLLSATISYPKQQHERKRHFPIMISLDPSYYISNQYRFIGDDLEKLLDGDTSPDYGDITYHPISITVHSCRHHHCRRILLTLLTLLLR